jgi:hypothetical protein
MLGIRQTVGSVAMLPPSRTQLVNSFNDLHKCVTMIKFDK